MQWLKTIPYRRLIALLWPLAGIALVGYGCYRIYPPAAYIVVGLLIILDTLHATRNRVAK